ncbi:MAG TPA: CHASE2 domain-containing protein [Bryobacteraceae bacterium]|nr:CHASE2 domain-containing protein [Bryobacteraceae bacterium]
MKPRRQPRFTWGYAGVVCASLAVALVAGWTTLAVRMDRDAYDWMSRIHPPTSRAPASVVLAFDEESLGVVGGERRLRTTLAAALERILEAGPAAVAIDVTLADTGDPVEDGRLATALKRIPNLVLATELAPSTQTWVNPAPAFRPFAMALGHVHAAPDPVSRVLPLEIAAARERRWAMALEVARLRAQVNSFTETTDAVEFGDTIIPARRLGGRTMFIRYREGVPVVPVVQVISDKFDKSDFAAKAVFVGVVAQSAARDRLITPLDRSMAGVEIHAQAFETIANRQFLETVPLSVSLLLCTAFAVAAAIIFGALSGWIAYAAAAALLLIAHLVPHVAFSSGRILPYLSTVWSAWLPAVTAASWQHFVVRRKWQQAESDKLRYQQAIHFVTHEMRSPLTAIQGSSELMGRYALSEDKRKQMVSTINAESKRLGKMIQTFLDIERLTDGQMELRIEPFSIADVAEVCHGRALPLAERKSITLRQGVLEPVILTGDRELLEYAVYNLLTNAIKYSPSDTSVVISATMDGRELRFSVADQGMGMDEKELKNLGRKFYRTRRAEVSGEAGTGIGLSLVQQIVAHHGGRMEVTSAPGQGSCFTMVLPAAAAVSR